MTKQVIRYITSPSLGILHSGLLCTGFAGIDAPPPLCSSIVRRLGGRFLSLPLPPLVVWRSVHGRCFDCVDRLDILTGILTLFQDCLRKNLPVFDAGRGGGSVAGSLASPISLSDCCIVITVVTIHTVEHASETTTTTTTT